MSQTSDNLLSQYAGRAWPAPAKINLFLHVVGRRADGYHELQTAFQFLNFGDELYFAVNTTGLIERQYDFGFSEQQDLCLKAARALKRYAPDECGVSIDLIKRLPMGGGLGGGSSNAATVLIALNYLWGLGLSRETLADIGLNLGADVPVFVHGFAAWAEGVGELLTRITPPQCWYVVLHPNAEVSTAQIFANKCLTPRPKMKRIRALENSSEQVTVEIDGVERVIDSTFGENQLEPIVRRQISEVNELLEWLGQYGAARMSGSGGSVFVAVSSEVAAVNILEKRPIKSMGFIAKGENFHPLFRKLQ